VTVADLVRFVEAQAQVYGQVVDELTDGDHMETPIIGSGPKIQSRWPLIK
jgi:uncharacterized protein (DUF1810 family)